MPTRRAMLTLTGLAALPAMAAETRLLDDAGRMVALPPSPRRIASLDDMGLTVPLLELGITPVASVGRPGRDGKPFIRGALALTGDDFGTNDMRFLGMRPIDLETLVAARPDLILTPLGAAATPEQLAAIAPTFVLDDRARGGAATYALLARLTGREAEAARLERRYQAQLAELRRAYRPERFTVAVISATGDGKLSLDHTYGSLGQVLRDAGFRFPAIYDGIPPHQAVVLSPELLQSVEADIIIDTYRDDRLEMPAAADRRLRALHPDYCRFLDACRAGRLVVLPRDAAMAVSYQSRSLAIGALTTLLGGEFGRTRP